jgi:hypothetical protein
MKILLISLLLLSSSAFADKWRTSDTYREVGYMTLHALDFKQTHDIAANPDKYFERNHILGEHPDSAQVNTYFAATALAHYGIARILPHEWREIFQYVTIGVESQSVFRNFSLGIGGSF